MDIDKIKNEWSQTHPKSGTEMFEKILRENRESKLNQCLTRVVTHNIIWIVYHLVILVFSWQILLSNVQNLALAIIATIGIVLSKIFLIRNILHLNLVHSTDFSRPIVEAKRNIEKLKKYRIQYNRDIFILSNLYFWTMISLVFQWDIVKVIEIVWANAPIVVVFHLGFAVLWFPISIWLLKKYDASEGSSKNLAKDSYLTDSSLNVSLNNSIESIAEIDAFLEESNS